MGIRTNHHTFPKSLSARGELRGMFEENISFPLEKIYQLLEFDYNEACSPPEENDTDELKAEIQLSLQDLENAEKLRYVLKCFVFPQQDRLSDVSNLFLDLLDNVLERLVMRTDLTVIYLRNAVFTSELQLEKRQQKRRRYKTNKKNARGICCGTSC